MSRINLAAAVILAAGNLTTVAAQLDEGTVRLHA